MFTSASPATALRIASWITAINVLIAAGYSVAGIVSPTSILPAGLETNEASSIFALYGAARAMPFAIVTLVVIYQQWPRGLALVGALAGVIQLLDAGVGFTQADPRKIIGPLVIAVLQFLALSVLYRSGKSTTTG
ncbi:MAG: hypothetical protein JWO51_4041 [Rhodospirillales bacterium]|jgi:hypothetical protein|nr:hypothetical protein [Rhodospirillales bacterium]